MDRCKNESENRKMFAFMKQSTAEK